ncbi:MAG: nicotinate-nucleotide adenylyltransferase [Betaproteobacteria bacterium]|nr:nicotinate-nucleotide adenylyltransferase [Betaproteobacteria bacterium]
MGGSAPGPVGILGGTFDPIHLAHLRLAQEALERCRLAQVRLVPSARPPHRDVPGASAEQRLRMVELAIRGNPGLAADDRELRRSEASFTIDTVASLRAELGQGRSLCLILGADAFALFETWKQWRILLDQVHVIVACRPGYDPQPASPVLGKEYRRRCIGRPEDLESSSGGLIYPLAITALDISASRIREDLAAGTSPRYLLPDSVLGYIESNHLYRSPDAG